MGPRANFECRQCAVVETGDKATGAVVVYEDLPIKSTRCPVCGFKKGFRRRFDAVNVSTVGHYVAKKLDPMMEPQFEQQAAARAQAQQSDRDLREEHARAIEALPESRRPAMREAMAQGPVRWLDQPAATRTLGAVPPQARRDTHDHTWPHIRRRVVPTAAH